MTGDEGGGAVMERRRVTREAQDRRVTDRERGRGRQEPHVARAGRAKWRARSSAWRSAVRIRPFADLAVCGQGGD
jgi:hypothetical protein